MFRMDHVNLNVTDLARSIAFFEQAFELKEVKRKSPEDGSFIIVFLSDGTSDFLLELTWLKDKDGPYNLGDNESHICFAAQDIEASLQRHKKMDIVVYENTKMGVYFVADPDGYWHEVKQS